MPAATARISLTGLPGLPEVRAGESLAPLLAKAAADAGMPLADGDVLVLAQKIVSKSEGRLVALSAVTPSPRARELAAIVNKDARLVELVLRESTEVLRARKDVLVVSHKLGFVMANAGIDFSNVAQPGDVDDRGGGRSDAPADGLALLLPEDPDASCARLRAELLALTGATVGVVINDSHGRAWRLGTSGVAIGAAGVPALSDLRGRHDRFGRTLRITMVGTADELAAAGSLVMGQADEGLPAVLVRGWRPNAPAGRAADLVRPVDQDLFR
jgi:coenzyme F420-0:L-glutamate ligase/coenzyme F420-1:gamma-L-glutamate ligase